MSESKHLDAQELRLNRRLSDTPIAIVGMASLFANSRYLNQFWDLICEKIDAITEVPADRWQIDDFYDSEKKTPDKSYCKRGGFIPEVDFNPLEFGLPPNILELTDSAQLLSLIVAKEVLEDAGISEGSPYDRDRIGITLGIGGGQKISQSLNARLQYPVLKKVFRESGISDADIEMLIRKFQSQYVHWEENSFPGSLGNVIAGRIANRFDLGGMNCVVDAACAGSLAAIRMALTELVEGRSDMMLTGGACTDNSAYMYMSFSKTPAFTDDDKIKPFDADSRGMMIGEGIGMVALKRLSDAERDGDRIYAVIKGVGASSDGKFKSIYAPRPEGQAKALRRAYEDAGFAAHTLGLMEAHGTGTAAGDVAEFSGLRQVMGEGNDQHQHIALGSIKSQVGHTKSTAGTAGLIKAALALHHKVLPPTINIQRPNPKLEIEQSPFYLSTESRPWLPRPDGTPRRAAVSSFGFGGTNFHLVMEEYSNEHTRKPYRLRHCRLPLLFAAPSKALLLTQLESLRLQLDSRDTSFDALVSPYVLSGTAIAADWPRLGLITANAAELKAQLDDAISQLQTSSNNWRLAGISFRSEALVGGKTAALFAGQGSQYPGMGSELAQLYPEMRSEFCAADSEFMRRGYPGRHGMGEISSHVFPIPRFDPIAKQADEQALTNTRIAQSAIGAVSLGQFEILKAAGFRPDAVAGHSFGELSALRAADVIDKEAYYRLAFERGHAMASTRDGSDPGTMAAVILNEPTQRRQLDEVLATHEAVLIANINSPLQLVIAGPSESLIQAVTELKQRKIRAITLPVSGAFHTALVGHAQAPFAAAVARETFADATLTFYTNASGDKGPMDANALQQNLQTQMLAQVQFAGQIESMYRDGVRIFVEFGPKNTLSRLIETILGPRATDCLVLAMDSAKGADDQLKLATLELAMAGLAINNPDPYRQSLSRPPLPTSPLTVKLSASNYLSPATAAKMAAALKDGQISKHIEIVEKIVDKTQYLPAVVADRQANNVTPETATVSRPVAGLDALFAAQQQLAQLHQQFLTIPAQYGDSINALLQKQLELAANGTPIPVEMERTLALFHQHQADTLKIHTEFMQAQVKSSEQLLGAIMGQPIAEQPAVAPRLTASPSTPLVAAPATMAASIAATVPQATPPQQHKSPKVNSAPLVTASVNVATSSAPLTKTPPAAAEAELRSTLLEVVAGKTGYPAEMLELCMDMEADLGIDSIKRVEILGTVQDRLPMLPELDPAVLAECRSLQDIVDCLGANSQEDIGNDATGVHQSESQPASADNHIRSLMLEVVAAKTGYPVEMLDLAMDMEADLGIDSIKRVEILGTVQDRLPSLPELDPALLAECRTLQDIIHCMGADIPKAMDNSHSHTQVTAPGAVTAGSDISALMLEVVAAKTGYPVEMLDLAMDMEADLGIDSIKRVEILGTVQDRLPSLPELDPAILAECRTLGHIIDCFAQTGTDNATASVADNVQPQTAKVAEDPARAGAGLNHQTLEQTLLQVVATKTGYPAEMLDLAMDMEADLGIDSIKRVEILGTVQDALPTLPELDPATLAECRSLGQILDSYSLSHASSPTGSPSSSNAAEMPAATGKEPAQTSNTIAPITANQLPPHTGVALKKLPAADRLEAEAAEALFAAARVVILDDGHNAGVLAGRLASKGMAVTVVRPHSLLHPSVLEASIDARSLTADSDAAVAALVKSLGTVAAFIHLQPQQDSKALHFCSDAFARVELAFLFAKHLAADFNKPASHRRAFIACARQDGKLGLSGNPYELNQAALFGLCKTLAQEWPHAHCLALDIAVDLDATALAEAVLDALFAPTQTGIEAPLEWGVCREGRFGLCAVDMGDNLIGCRLDSSDKILVTGGAKGVTLDCALALAGRTGAHFILAGRSKVLAEADFPAWAKGLGVNELKQAAIAQLLGSGKRSLPREVDALVTPLTNTLEIRQAIKCFEAVGASAEYLSLDVTNPAAVTQALEPLLAIAPISGLIHGAGVLADKLIQDKTLDELSRVTATKVAGLATLLSTLGELKLLALFSSAAGFYGNRGQSDYAMANEILNKCAWQLSHSHKDCRVVAFDWGPWDGGMVSDSLKKMFETRGVYVIPRPLGANLFAEAVLHRAEAQILVGSSMQGDVQAHPTTTASDDLGQIRLGCTLRPAEFGLLAHHQLGGHPVLPTVCALEWMLRSASRRFGGHWQLGDYRLLKGIVFDNNEKHLRLSLTPVKGALQAVIECDGRPQYQALLSRSERLELPQFDRPEGISTLLSGEALYLNGTLFHGPALQVIGDVTAVNDQGLCCRFSLPSAGGDDLGVQNLAVIAQQDGLLQALLIWARLKYDAASLPASLETLTQLRTLTANETGHIRLWVREHSRRQLTADVALYDSHGRLASAMQGARVTISKQLDQAFGAAKG